MCQSTGYFELQLISVDNPKGQLLNGDCCDAEKSAAEGHCGSDECDTYFKVCLKEYQTDVTTSGPCTYGSETTKVIGGNTFHFKGGQKTGSNRNNEAGKIIIPFQFAWPVSASKCRVGEVEVCRVQTKHHCLWMKVECGTFWSCFSLCMPPILCPAGPFGNVWLLQSIKCLTRIVTFLSLGF